MSTYSDKIFKDVSIIIADASYLSKATDDDYCFIENCEYDVDLKALGFKKTSTGDLQVLPTKKITEEIYERIYFYVKKT